MRVALICPGFSANSDDWAIPALLDLARELAEIHEVWVFSQRYPAKGLYQFDNLTHLAIGGQQRYGPGSVRIWLETSRAIIRQHRATPFDILHAIWVDEAGFSAVLAGARIKRPVIVSLGGGELTRLAHIAYGAQRFLSRRLTTRYALKKSTIVTAGSAYQLGLCRAYPLPETKLRFAPLGVDIDRFQPGEKAPAQSENGRGVSETVPTLVQAASLVSVKNQVLLLQVLQKIKTELPAINLNLAGSGTCYQDLLSRARCLNVDHNIHWRGYVPYPLMPRIYRQSDLYLQTSHHESQGMAVLEAMACGIPVIGTPVGIARDVACRPASSSAELLAAQAVDILRDKMACKELRERARQTVETEFELGLSTRRFTKLYSEAVDGETVQ